MPTDKLDAQLTPRIFFNKVLAGTASGTIIALAVLGAILKYFAEYKNRNDYSCGANFPTSHPFNYRWTDCFFNLA